MISRSHDSTVDLDIELAAQAGAREPGLLRAVRACADRLDPAQRRAPGRSSGRFPRPRPGTSPWNASERELHPPPAQLPERGARGDQAARRAPDRRLRARARSGVRRVLSRLTRVERARPGITGVQDRAQRCIPTHTRRRAGSARRLSPGGNVDVDANTSLTVKARLPNPYIHVDNRGLILCNGARCVCVPASQLRTCAETFDIIANERRATRTQGPHLVGGYIRRRLCRPLRRTPGRPGSRYSPDLALRFDALREDALVTMRLLLASARRCSCGGARGRRGEAADAVLAAADSEPYVHRSTTVDLRARRPQAPGGARLRARFPGAGARRQQGPGRQAAAGLRKMMVHHLLYFAPRRVDQGRRLPRRRVHRRPRRGAPGRALRHALPAGSAPATASTTPTLDGRAPGWRLTAMVMNHYQRKKRSTCARRSGTRPSRATGVPDGRG